MVGMVADLSTSRREHISRNSRNVLRFATKGLDNVLTEMGTFIEISRNVLTSATNSLFLLTPTPSGHIFINFQNGGHI